MGNSGSYTSKAHLHTSLYTFTKWGKIHINDFLLRGQLELSETFGLRRYEVEFLVGRELVDFPTVRSLFSDVFDTDKNSVIDKFELMSMVCLVSKISNLEKIHFLFDLFNFNEKGYLIESELMLLFLSISRGAYKVDQKYAPLPIKAINGLVKDALSFAVKDSTQASLRKPELVQFVLDTDKVMAFLESWRGIASQVLIRPGERWRDLSFPANETSIYATDEWLRTGLPPADFVKWRRCSKVGHDGGCDKLFSHTVGYMKTVDRKPIYEGWGCLASGHIKQGMLSDRWLLNGLACIFAKPVITTACFASTGQEVSIGRYCIRIYEGGAWRSVYLDDRIPCGKNCLPLFASSSDPSESFVMLLEKGVAKYLGSYGHLARASAVPDATLTSLRMLTGGHVFREATLHYEWRSLDEEILGESGRKFVDCLLKEGSLVSFGRAESIAYMKRRDLQINLDDEDEIDPSAAIPPYGRLFPLLGIVTIQSCVYLILRDAWGLNTNIDEGIDFETGHSRTFQVPVEEIPLLYDVMIISRFPDSLQPMMEKHNLTPWRTEVRGQATNGVKNPAKFKLILPKKVPEQLHKSEPKTNSKKKSTEAAVNETLRKVDELDIYDVDPSAYIKKNATSFARFKTDPKRETIISNMSRRPSLQDNLTRMTESLIDIAFTISGSIDWGTASMQDVGAKVRIRFVPSSRTREDIMMFSTLLNAEKKRIEERIAKRKADALKMMEIPTDTGMEVKKRANSTFTDEVDLTYIGSQEGTREGKEVESRNRTESYQSEVTFARSRKNTEITLNSVQESLECSEEPGDSVAGSLQDTKKNTKSNMKEDNMWDMVLGAERSWISHSVKLMPGEYFVFADVSYDLPYEEIFLRSTPADINESPWLDSESPLMDEYHPLNGNNNSILTFSSAADIAASHSNVLSSKKSMIDSKKSFIQPKEKVELKRSPRVWLQISSISKFEIESSTADSPLSIPPGLSTSVEHIEIQPETHPFVGESQSETASRELFELLTKYKGEMAAVGAEYMYLNNSYQEYQQRINELAKLG